MDYLFHNPLKLEARSFYNMIALKKVNYLYVSQNSISVGIGAVACDYWIIDFLKEDISDLGINL